MNNLAHILDRVNTRTLLIGIALVLLALNAGRFCVDFYWNQQAALESRTAMLAQYQLSVRKLAALKTRVEALAKQKEEMDAYLFNGRSVEEVSSNMQIALQKQLTDAGLVLETLRPSSLADKEPGKTLGQIAVNVRLTGSLNGFTRFLANLYKSDKLFQLDSFTLKPSRNSGLTIFLEMKGFYKLV